MAVRLFITNIQIERGSSIGPNLTVTQQSPTPLFQSSKSIVPFRRFGWDYKLDERSIHLSNWQGSWKVSSRIDLAERMEWQNRPDRME